jgi:hypothetical protein
MEVTHSLRLSHASTPSFGLSYRMLKVITDSGCSVLSVTHPPEAIAAIRTIQLQYSFIKAAP